MYEYRVVAVSVQGRGAARKYPYHELRLVHKLVGGGHYEHSRGCTIIRRSGPRRGTQRLREEYEAEAERLQAELEESQRAEREAEIARYLGDRVPATAAGVVASVPET